MLRHFRSLKGFLGVVTDPGNLDHFSGQGQEQEEKGSVDLPKGVERLRIDQANVFYNFTAGASVTNVDLVATAGKLLKSGLSPTVCFSDLKCIYLDEKGDYRLEWVRPEGREWDSEWELSLSQDIPESTLRDLIYSVGMVFHDNRLEGSYTRQMAPCLRAPLPPIILESNDLTLPLYAWIKLFSDGICILSFQLDTTWNGLDEESWISIEGYPFLKRLLAVHWIG